MIAVGLSVLWLFAVVVAGALGKAKINDVSLPQPWGAIVSPLIFLFMGTIFAVIGLVYTIPLWIWFVTR